MSRTDEQNGLDFHFKRYHISHNFPEQCKQCQWQCITNYKAYKVHNILWFRRTELWSLSTYLFRNSLVQIRIQNTIQSVIFKLVSTDLHILFRYFRISKFLVRASTGNTNWLSKQCCPSTRETSETDSSHITPVAWQKLYQVQRKVRPVYIFIE
jgi:hypothetical protein